MNPVIEAQGIGKQFKFYRKSPGVSGSVKALFYRNYQLNPAVMDFDVTISRGEIVGLLGPNGAGKTTLMKMFSGIIVPSQGTLQILGYIPSKRVAAFCKKIALVMGQKSQLWWDLPAMDSFRLLQRYYEIGTRDFQSRLNELCYLLDAGHLLQIHVRKLSLGERMKVELIASLLHQPEVIFLDEPTIGLDLVAQRNIRDFLKHYHRQTQATIILTSHYMADVTALCSRLVLVLGGRKRFDGPLSRFETLLGQEKEVYFSFTQPIHPHEEFWKKFDAQWNPDCTQVSLRIPESELRSCSIRILENYPVAEFGTEKMPVERVMKALMENPHLIQSS